MILLLDNYDSFTYNLFQFMGELGAEVVVKRNDELSVAEIREMRPESLVVSPGPRYPSQAGISEPAILELYREIPILGVCLGHQAIFEVFGGSIVKAGALFHGKDSRISHSGDGIFRDLEEFPVVGRYHSLVGDPETLPADLEITASDLESNLIMGIRHKNYPTLNGIQFHPESVLTPSGKKLLSNFLKISRNPENPLLE